jgi:hypothetical protein
MVLSTFLVTLSLEIPNIQFSQNLFLVNASDDKQVLCKEIERISMTFWVVVPCNILAVCQHFRGTCCLHHQG